MIRLYLFITYLEMVELREHLLCNGYHFSWEVGDVLVVNEDEVTYIKEILYDREIRFVEE